MSNSKYSEPQYWLAEVLREITKRLGHSQAPKSSYWARSMRTSAAIATVQQVRITALDTAETVTWNLEESRQVNTVEKAQEFEFSAI